MLMISKQTERYKAQITELMEKYAPDCQALWMHILNDHRFLTWTGSGKPSQHHYGEGGLIQHTYEVLHLSMHHAEFAQSVDKVVIPSVLAVAALFHDYGKCWDYKLRSSDSPSYDADTGKWASTAHKSLVYHISRSAIEFDKLANQYNMSEWFIEQVVHCILSHHGHREWGSPVLPKTIEAHILHLSDMVSARIQDQS